VGGQNASEERESVATGVRGNDTEIHERNKQGCMSSGGGRTKYMLKASVNELSVVL
jgi:hypothetical protein